MQNFDEIEELMSQAENYINRAETYIADGKIMAGFKMYQKSADIYFKTGSYMRIPDIFIRISTLLRKETTIYAAMEYLRRTRSRFRKLDLPEEEAKIMMVMGNLAFKVSDYDSAAEYFEDAADLYLKADPEEYRPASSMFLVRSAECYERMKRKHEKGERIIIQAALRLNQKTIDFQAEEYKAIRLFKNGDYKEAIPIYEQLYEFFTEALGNLSVMVQDTPAIFQIAIYAKTRFIHIISEYRMILMFLYDLIGEDKRSKEMALDSIDHLNAGIELIKGMIIKGFWSKDDLKRLTYEGFMRAYFQKYWHIKNQTPEEQIQHAIVQDLPQETVEIIKKLPYYDLCVKTETYALKELHELMDEFNLGRLEKYKELFIKLKKE